MIVAKAANMELVVFLKNNNGWSCKENQSDIQFHEQFDYFLCLPQHKDECLKWLNGSIMEQRIIGGEDLDWSEMLKSSLWKWDVQNNTMKSKYEFRIKPKKEKRWIGYCASTNQTFPNPHRSKDVAEDYAARNYSYSMDEWQFIEIEVEV